MTIRKRYHSIFDIILTKIFRPVFKKTSSYIGTATFNYYTLTGTGGTLRVDFQTAQETLIDHFLLQVRTSPSGSWSTLQSLPAFGFSHVYFYSTSYASGTYDVRLLAYDVNGNYEQVAIDTVIVSAAAAFGIDSFSVTPIGSGDASFAASWHGDSLVDYILFEYSPAGANTWTLFYPAFPGTSPVSESGGYLVLSPGNYDFRLHVYNLDASELFPLPTVSNVAIT